MRKEILLIVVVMVLVGLSGCPLLGIGGDTGNKLVVHNQRDIAIPFLSAVRVSDECSLQKPNGVNLLPEPIEPGKSFTINNLPDGRYYCEQPDSDGDSGVYVTLGGGKATDWYVTFANN